MHGPQFPQPDHDHGACLDRLMVRARVAFAARGGRFTQLREAVLRVLAESHRCFGAYEIVKKLRHDGRRVAAVSVYRVLEALLAAGLVHRIESRNAYVACHRDHRGSVPIVFLMCERCGIVAESADADLAAALRRQTRSAGFRASGAVLEISGFCDRCAA